ncbi:hypothetical protein KJ632_05355, partial [Patescibacteria group bacterium]|nr:hypothetical protein [Patescibacteria group bacterium]
MNIKFPKTSFVYLAGKSGKEKLTSPLPSGLEINREKAKSLKERGTMAISTLKRRMQMVFDKLAREKGEDYMKNELNDYEIAQTFTDSLKKAYSDRKMIEDLPYLEHGDSEIEMKFDFVNDGRWGADELAVPDSMWVKVVRGEDGVPGLEFRWGQYKQAGVRPGYSERSFVDEDKFFMAQEKMREKKFYKKEKKLEVKKEKKVSKKVEVTKERALTDREKLAKEVSVQKKLVNDKLKNFKLKPKSKMSDVNFAQGAEKNIWDMLKDPSQTWLRERNCEALQIDANQWDVVSEAYLSRSYVEMEAVGVPVEDSFYQKMFSLLKQGAGKYSKDPEKSKWFLNPSKYLTQINALPGFGQAYASAYISFTKIKESVMRSADAKERTLEEQQVQDELPGVTVVKDFVGARVGQFMKAAREGDIATMGVFAAGLVGLFYLTKGVLGNKWLRRSFLGLAGGYCAYVFAKKSGYDLFKMMGVKNTDDEVNGTPMEAFRRMKLEEAKGLDYSVMLKLSEVKAEDMYELYKDANSNGDHFIHPSQFPDLFPDIAAEGGFMMGIGENGILDSGMNNKELSYKQREYIRVGKQLYKAMHATHEAYKQNV